MAKKIILKLANIQEYSDVADNFNASRLSRFATRAQETPLRELLGDPLYYLLINDLDASGVPQNEPYIKLVNGTTYTYDGDTIEYFGLKPFLTYHWLALNIKEGDLFMSDTGNIQFSEHEQDNMVKVSKKTIDSINSTYMKEVVSYSNNIAKYLNENASTYPEWDSKSDHKSKSGFNSFTV